MAVSHIQNLDVLASPDSHLPLRVSRGEEGILCSDENERFKIVHDIIYLLPRNIAEHTTKTREREGWKKIFEDHKWVADPSGILGFPDSSQEDLYWRKVRVAFGFALRILGDLSGKKGIDLACGIGWASAKFVQRGAAMIAADFNDTVYNGLGAATQLHKMGINFDAVCCDGESLPIADNSLDFAFICSALHHFTDPQKTLREISRVLKPGAVFIDICESFRTGYGDAVREEKHDCLMEFRGAGINEQSFTQKEYEEMFRKAGFTLVTLATDWMRLDETNIFQNWLQNGLDDLSETHPRRIMRWILKYLRSPAMVKFLVWRRLHFTAVDRIFVATKARQ